ncbi:hypothetical protein [uncultured Gammaproteobacteria bacterium]|jgi:hypothetical protein|nr:hypothetical protein BROOK1789C_1658 [Bathymodiolus brooksi thiotrophic gill symbiont]CAC9561123.1 hypothetical protein [uncultured Gammaproteobacteria bacterium]CAC9567616.1 hypothetical protein [uncultured Gammaproteobacteria bacterium]CAC9577636.1 hypothetical protein [uncultured Gammaproteobacteria bacterium]CAC9581611.1 hypothetical protein [uncultured Gammaproteobacteria bacterium]
MRQLKLWTKPERQGQINARILNANCIEIWDTVRLFVSE